MGEPTCVMHPFSYTSPEFPSETHQENPMYEIGESVSFGRFMTENLSWERWSTFNNNRNRYVEEAKNYSRPGSVAQKKAYFEAHFKRMAALKAAALLEQNMSEGVVEGEVASSSMSQQVQPLIFDGQIESNSSEQEAVEKEGDNEEADFVVHQNELYNSASGGEDEELDANIVKEVNLTMQDIPSDQDELNLVIMEKENLNSVIVEKENYKSSEESSGITQMDESCSQKSNLKEEASTTIVKRNPPLSSYISPIDGIGRAALFASSPAKSTASVYPGKENSYATPTKNKSSINEPDKKRTPLRMSINREFSKIISPVIRKIGSSSKASKDCSTPLRTPVKDREEGRPEDPTMTPNLAKRGKTPGPRWHILSTDGSKSPSTSRTKISSPIIPTSFCMKSGDRAARRKQKLEEKFNATTSGKAPQPSKFKEKAEAELNKFRQSFCFKAMSSPDRYTEIGTQKSPKHKSDSTRRASPRRGLQPHTSATQSRSSLPPRRPAVNSLGSRLYRKNTTVE